MSCLSVHTPGQLRSLEFHLNQTRRPNYFEFLSRFGIIFALSLVTSCFFYSKILIASRDSLGESLGLIVIPIALKEGRRGFLFGGPDHVNPEFFKLGILTIKQAKNALSERTNDLNVLLTWEAVLSLPRANAFL